VLTPPIGRDSENGRAPDFQKIPKIFQKKIQLRRKNKHKCAYVICTSFRPSISA
jgi:hypothetical protein